MSVSPWLLRPPGGGPETLRLFCFPYAGGGGSGYMGWARQVPRGLGVWAVQLPGRENRLRERSLTEMPEILEGALEAIRPHLDVPFALFGHSMGALIAFEVARHLRRVDETAPVRLLVSTQRASGLPRRRPPIAHLPSEEFVVELRRRYAGVPEALLQQPDLEALFLPCLQADMGLVERYRCDDEPPLDCPISACARQEVASICRDLAGSTCGASVIFGDGTDRTIALVGPAGD
jgi:surfactin synthase thioesterase subunit